MWPFGGRDKDKAKFAFKPFTWPPNDRLAAEHAAIAKWVDDALGTRREHRWYEQVELKSLPSGQVILDATPEQARRYVLAAVAQARYFDEEAERVRAQGTTEMERVNAHHLPGWEQVWGRRRQIEVVASSLLRRALPLEKDDLLVLLRWCNDDQNLATYHAPLGAITKSLQRFASEHQFEPALLDATREFARKLRGSHDRDAKKLATPVEQLAAEAGGSVIEAPVGEMKPTPTPAPAGDTRILQQLKRLLGVVDPATQATGTSEIGPDRFPLHADSPLAEQHALLTELLSQWVGTQAYHNPPVTESLVGRQIAAMDDADRGTMLLAAAERSVAAGLAPSDYNDPPAWQSRYSTDPVVRKLAALPFSLRRENAFDYLLYVATRVTPSARFAHDAAIERCLATIEKDAAQLSEGERYVLHLLRASFISGPQFNKPGAEVLRLNTLIGDDLRFFLVPGEAWSDALNAGIGKLPAAKQQAWIELLRHLLTATSARPSAKWLKTAEKLVDTLGAKAVTASLEQWLPLVSKGQTVRRPGLYTGDVRGEADTINEENANCLRGMLWIVPALKSPQTLARIVTSVALSAYKKVPGVGPRAVKVGNAAVYALSEMASPEAVGQLAMLKVRVKFGTAQKEIEKAFTAAAEALSMPRDQIEEMGVPSYGLEEVGRRREEFGECVAEMVVDGRDVELKWSKEGKSLKSVPAKVKAEHKEELKELQTAATDIAAMLPAQVERIDSLFLLQKRWPLSVWRERYLDHPLVGTIARRLIWNFGEGVTGMFHDGAIVNVDDEPLQLADGAHVELWHPIGRPMDDVLAWRTFLERHQLRQPFKQAHRELYVLTDAERRTNTYSNRFAAHVLRQHQFNALCANRGWKNKLRLMVDDSYTPASRELPQWGLRAEFWIEGIGDGYGTDTNDSGAYLRIATDQVRFYRTGAAQNYAHAGGGGYTTGAADAGQANINEPIALDQVPPLVLSEIMRDVDLFVGVASVGNDPTWQDGGPGGRYQTYWQSYSFGELTETAKTRKAVLERLVPRLKIAAKCAISDKFLVVRGEIRTYKIHLGSGNILMEPNDQYLCIVPDRSSVGRGGAESVLLPFEGDNTLSIILSKAFLLADDRKIKDATITRQINH